MIVDVLVKEKRVVDESIELCKWLVLSPEVFSLSQEYFTKLCLTPKMFDVECWQLKCACYETTYKNQATQDTF